VRRGSTQAEAGEGHADQRDQQHYDHLASEGPLLGSDVVAEPAHIGCDVGSHRGEAGSETIVEALIHAPFEIVEALIDLIEALIDLDEPLVDLIEALIDLDEPLVDLREPLVDLREAVVDLQFEVADAQAEDLAEVVEVVAGGDVGPAVGG
jgi:hypothetical protein